MNEINLFSEIGNEVTAKAIKSQLSAASDNEPLVVRVDSEGGSVFEGFSIYSAFQAYTGAKTCIIESAAFSIASYIAMAFDRVQITSNGYVMIHNPSTEAYGDDKELARNATLLAKLKDSMVQAYSDKTGIEPGQIEQMMDDETFLNAEEALAMGFVDEIVDYAKPSRVIEGSGKKKESMPFRVVAALGGVASDSGEKTVDVKGVSMPESAKKVAATVKQIKARFPKAKDSFIVKAMEEELPMEEVVEEMIESLQAENEQLMARISAMEEEMAAKAMEGEDPGAMEEEEPEAMEEEEEMVAKAKAKSGVKPVARVSGGKPAKTARAQWSELIDSFTAKGLDRATAVRRANKENPGLRQRMLDEAQV